MPFFLHPNLESMAFCPRLPRQQKAPRFFREDDSANFWPACPDLRRGMSPHSGVSQVPRLRAETHFGVQARALSVGLHPLRHQPLGNCKSDNGLSPAKELACPPARSPISGSLAKGRRLGKGRFGEQVRIQTLDFPSLLTNVRSLWSIV